MVALYRGSSGRTLVLYLILKKKLVLLKSCYLYQTSKRIKPKKKEVIWILI